MRLIHAYDRLAYRALPGTPEAEFCAGMSFGASVPLATVTPELEGTLLLTGHPGDDIWTTDGTLALPELLAPQDRFVEGLTLSEYRLRAGFLWFPVPWIGAYHKQAIHRITASGEMRPWSLPGKSNRPCGCSGRSAQSTISSSAVAKHTATPWVERSVCL